MKVGIIGTRGIPNHYGGFEQFAMELSRYLVQQGHQVYTYSTSDHPYQESSWEGVQLIHQYNPEKQLGLFAQFIYDLKCILDARRRGFDILLQLGYTTSAVWSFLLPRNSIVVTNMDGLEWKRSKYPALISRFLKLSEYWAIKSSQFLIADSIGIQKYLSETYGVAATFIAYGADVITTVLPARLLELNLEARGYCLLIARMQTDNNVATIIEGYLSSGCAMPLIVVGNYRNSKVGKQWFGQYNSAHIRFVGGIYDKELLDQLRYHCYFYFHGHSCGGTNPSLLEAMACKAHVVAHDNIFNQSVLGDNAFYFSTADDIANILQTKRPGDKVRAQNAALIQASYSLRNIHQRTEQFLLQCLGQKK